MNRFRRGTGNLLPKEREILLQKNVAIYDGEEKTNFEKGILVLTNFRILWREQGQFSNVNELALQMQMIATLEEQPGSFSKSAKIVVHLSVVGEKVEPEVFYSTNHHIKLSFRKGGQNDFLKKLNDALAKKEWEIGMPKFRPGIVGIERQIQAKNQQAEKHISVAFEDLSKLMDMAKQMVSMAKNISQKIRDKQGEISDDETLIFKQQLLSLGISDPVTRNAHGSVVSFHKELAKQIAQVLIKPIEEAGGAMALTDCYCRVNRARGLDLLSPEDLLNACLMFESLALPLRIQVFESGVKIVQLASNDGKQASAEVCDLVESKGSLSADELAGLLNTTVVLSKERLLQLEREGLVCRDDSLEGLRFHQNLFLTQPVN